MFSKKYCWIKKVWQNKSTPGKPRFPPTTPSFLLDKIGNKFIYVILYFLVMYFELHQQLDRQYQ